MSYYYKSYETVYHPFPEYTGVKRKYTLKQYAGPFDTEEACVEEAFRSGLQDFEVLELP
jgi:hypothetical protein